MKVLADENVERSIVDWLRAHGHDVLWVPETHAAEADRSLVELARRENRVIVTYDLDFGEIIFRERMRCGGGILLRCKGLDMRGRVAWFQSWWPELELKAPNHFVVLRNNRLRVRGLWPGG